MQAEPKIEWTDEENLTEAASLKEKGNQHFKSKNLK